MAINRVPLPTQDELNDMFEYEPSTGNLRWKDHPNWTDQNRGRLVGKIAGHKRPNGTITIKIGGQNYMVSRVVWKMIKGTEPQQVRHRTDNIGHNTIENLQGRSQLKELPTGVTLHAKCRGYCASVRIEGVRRHLGTFNTVEKAAAACAAARTSAAGDQARGSQL